MYENIDNQKPFRVALFGGPSLHIVESVCPLSAYQGALLGLVFEGGPEGISRDELITLIWPTGDPKRTRRRLNQLLYSIKKRTGPDSPFESAGDWVLPVSSRTSSDMAVFEEKLGASRFSECAELVSLGFLRQVHGSISNDFSRWIEGKERSIRHRLQTTVLSSLGEREAAGDWDGVREIAQALCILEPLNEEFLRIFMKGLARVGRTLDSEAAFSQFSSLRASASGPAWEPAQETLALRERIRMEVERSPKGDSPDPEAAPEEVRLVGRDSERTNLRRVLATPPNQTFRGILVTGEAGIGKTRLVREAVTGLAFEGQRIFNANQAEFEQMIPLNPLIEALKTPEVGDTIAKLEDPWRAVIYGVMPRHFRGKGPIPQAPQIQPGSVPRRLFEACFQLLLRLASDSPVVLVLEDLQWVDETTLLVLEFLFRRWDRGRLQAVFTLRSEEIRRSSALKAFLDMLRLHGDFLEVPLGELARDSSKTLISDTATRLLRDEEIRHLYTLAGGNPFFLIELTMEYLAGRVDEPTRPEDVLSIPLSIRQVLDRRLSQLSQGAERTLGALSVQAKSLKIPDLAKVSGLSIPECMAGLDQLHEFRLVRNKGIEISVGHELIRQTVYQGLPSSRRAWLHGEVARHLLESAPDTPPDELAIHFHYSGAEAEALHYSQEAAERAEISGAIPEALRFLEISREHTDDPHAVAEIIGRMGHLNYLHQNLEEAAPLLEIAAQRFRRLGENLSALNSELEWVNSVGQVGHLPFREGLEELERIKDEARSAEGWKTFMKALDVEAHFRELSDDLDGVRRVLAQASKWADHGCVEAHSKAHALLALQTYFGSPERGLAAARRAVILSRKTSNEDLQLHALNRLIIALHHQGLLNLEEGREALAEAEKRLGTCGDLILKFFVRQNAAVWLLEIGELDRARQAFSTVAEVVKGTSARKPHVMLNINLGELHLDDGEIQKARKHYLLAETFLSPSSPRFFRTIIQAGLGLCALHDGDLREARLREGELGSDPTFWTFDPSLVTVFRTKMMVRRGNIRGALSHIEAVRGEIYGRFVSAWIRLLLENVRLSRRHLPSPNHEGVLSEAIGLCRDLGLRRRRYELENLR